MWYISELQAASAGVFVIIGNGVLEELRIQSGSNFACSGCAFTGALHDLRFMSKNYPLNGQGARMGPLIFSKCLRDIVLCLGDACLGDKTPECYGVTAIILPQRGS